jgi:hypothetical protein
MGSHNPHTKGLSNSLGGSQFSGKPDILAPSGLLWERGVFFAA